MAEPDARWMICGAERVAHMVKGQRTTALCAHSFARAECALRLAGPSDQHCLVCRVLAGSGRGERA